MHSIFLHHYNYRKFYLGLINNDVNTYTTNTIIMSKAKQSARKTIPPTDS